MADAGVLVVHAGFLPARIPLAGTLRLQPGGTLPHGVTVTVMAFEALFTAFCVAFLRVNMSKERAELEQRKAAFTNLLTGIANRRGFFDRGEPMLGRAIADRCSAALLLFDLDRFKEVNDTVGHQAGDRVLKAFADLIAASVRPATCPAGLAGGIRLFVDGRVHGRCAGGCRAGAQRVRRDAIPGSSDKCHRQRRCRHGARRRWKFTGAIGDGGPALYRAKADGRNCVAPAPLVLVDGGHREARPVPEFGRPATAQMAGSN